MNVRLGFLLCALWLSAEGPTQQPFKHITGDVRIQVLSPSLVRLEQKGPRGFEDRPTFHVVGRTWPFIKPRLRRAGGFDRIDLGTAIIIARSNARSLADCVIQDAKGRPIYKFDGKLSNSAWLPEPGQMPRAWSFADAPRIVPPKGGVTSSAQGWDSGNDAPDEYVFLPNGDYSRLRADFITLTGRVEMPPMYALGFWDSRYFVYTEETALQRIDDYRSRGFPIDGLVVNTDWRVGGSHGYDAEQRYFPDLGRFFHRAHEKNVRVMFNDHPEPHAKSALDPAELKYRWEGLAGLLQLGLDVWWYDRNWSVSLLDPASGLRHEVWGMRLYHDMTANAKPGTRPLMMANVDGIDNGFRNAPPNVSTHRYPMQWTGDTQAKWEFLRHGVENAVFSGVRGLNSYVNEDLGGHMGLPSSELYIRYLQFGALCPIMRVHCTKGQTREPWAFGEDAERISRNLIKMRYRLMPYLYAASRQAYDRGIPMLRRLDLEYPKYAEAARDDQYLLGPDLLVAPILTSSMRAVPATALANLRAEYYAGENLQGTPVITRAEADIDFDWGEGKPVSQLPSDHFSARFTGRISMPKSGRYRLAITADDGVRVWINGTLLIDRWVPQDNVTTEATDTLDPGTTYDLKIEYFERTGDAICKLQWRPEQVGPVSREVWIPPGVWRSVWNGKHYKGPSTNEIGASIEQIPMLVREGAVLPLAPQGAYVKDLPWDPITLDIWGKAGTTELYEDDGESIAYQTGAFRRTPISFKAVGKRTIITIRAAKGTFPGAPAERSWTLRVHDVRNPRTVSGAASWRLIQIDRKATPLGDPAGSPDGRILEIVLAPYRVGSKRTVVIEYP